MAACDSVNFSATALVLPYQKLDDIVGSSRLQSFGKRKGGKKILTALPPEKFSAARTVSVP